MKREKFTGSQKKVIANLNPSGKNVDYLSQLMNVSKTTIYKAKREGKFLNYIDSLERENNGLREFIVQEQLEKSGLISKNVKKTSGHF